MYADRQARGPETKLDEFRDMLAYIAVKYTSDYRIVSSVYNRNDDECLAEMAYRFGIYERKRVPTRGLIIWDREYQTSGATILKGSRQFCSCVAMTRRSRKY